MGYRAFDEVSATFLVQSNGSAEVKDDHKVSLERFTELLDARILQLENTDEGHQELISL